MSNKYTVVTNATVKVFITTSGKDKEIPIEKTFKKDHTLKTIKDKLEMITGGKSDTMKVSLFNKDDNLVCELNNDEALFGSYPIDDGMRLHIDDSFLLRSALEDDSNVEKFEMSPEDYGKRDENNAASIIDCRDVSSVVGPDKDNIEEIKNLEVKPLPRPKSNPLESRSQEDDISSALEDTEINGTESDSSKLETLKSSDDCDKTKGGFESDNSSKSESSTARSKIPPLLQTNVKKSELNVNAVEFVPRYRLNLFQK